MTPRHICCYSEFVGREESLLCPDHTLSWHVFGLQVLVWVLVGHAWAHDPLGICVSSYVGLLGMCACANGVSHCLPRALWAIGKSLVSLVLLWLVVCASGCTWVTLCVGFYLSCRSADTSRNELWICGVGRNVKVSV
jgi:hypothetical protein